jgi:hypothetical protein
MPERTCDAQNWALNCNEPEGHDDGGWHYDAADGVTWREGRHLPGEAAPALPAEVPLRLGRCPEHPGKVHAQAGSAGEWACLRGLADAAEAGVPEAAERTAGGSDPEAATEWAVRAAQACQERDDAREADGG